jgi:hypothetical protein
VISSVTQAPLHLHPCPPVHRGGLYLPVRPAGPRPAEPAARGPQRRRAVGGDRPHLQRQRGDRYSEIAQPRPPRCARSRCPHRRLKPRALPRGARLIPPPGKHHRPGACRRPRRRMGGVDKGLAGSAAGRWSAHVSGRLAPQVGPSSSAPTAPRHLRRLRPPGHPRPHRGLRRPAGRPRSRARRVHHALPRHGPLRQPLPAARSGPTPRRSLCAERASVAVARTGDQPSRYSR